MQHWTNLSRFEVGGGGYPGGGGEGEGQGEETWNAESSAWLLDEVDAVLDKQAGSTGAYC